ncbi:hypothetical protein V3C33_16340 [Micrococcaceae bacterium Sec5.7]
MSTVLIALVATAAAAALTWFFCIRPMRRNKAATGAAGCCAAPGADISEEIRATREELRTLQAQANPATGESPPSFRRES